MEEDKGSMEVLIAIKSHYTIQKTNYTIDQKTVEIDEKIMMIEKEIEKTNE